LGVCIDRGEMRELLIQKRRRVRVGVQKRGRRDERGEEEGYVRD